MHHVVLGNDIVSLAMMNFPDEKMRLFNTSVKLIPQLRKPKMIERDNKMCMIDVEVEELSASVKRCANMN